MYSILKISALSFFCGLMATAGAVSETDLVSIMTPKEKELRLIRKETVMEIRQVLGVRNSASRQADLYIKLAEAYFEDYRATFLAEANWFEKKQNGRGQIDHLASRKILEAGISACNEALRIAHSPKLDEIYYFLAVYHAELGQTERMQYYYREMIRLFPQSHFSSEAYQNLADQSFDDGKFSDAEKFYQKSITLSGRRDSRTMYRLAWSQYRQAHLKNARQTMRELVVMKDEEYHAEALKDLALFYADDEDPAALGQAVESFKSLGLSDSERATLFEELGAGFERNAEWSPARNVYQVSLSLSQNADEKARMQVKLCLLEAKRNDPVAANRQIHELNLPKSLSPALKQNVTDLQSELFRAGYFNHAQGKKKNNLEFIARARDFYAMDEKLFSGKTHPDLTLDTEKHAQVLAYLGDVERRLGNIKEAHLAFKQATELGPNPYYAENLLEWIALLSEQARLLPAQKNKLSSSDIEENLELASLKAVDVFKLQAPGIRARGAWIDLNAPKITREHADSARLAKIADFSHQITDTQPDTLLAVQTNDTVLDLYRELAFTKNGAPVSPEATARLAQYLDALSKNSALMAADQKLNDGALTAKMMRINQGLRVGVITQFENQKAYGKAGKEYLKLAQSLTNASEAQNAFALATESFAKEKDYAGVENTIKAWKNKFPQAPARIESVKRVAELAFIHGDFLRAARLYESLAQSSAALAKEALRFSLKLYLGSRENSAVARLVHTMDKRDPVFFSEMTFLAGQYYWMQEQFSLAVPYFKECSYAHREEAPRCLFYLAKISLTQKKDPSAYLSALDKVAKTPGSQPWIGGGKYLRATIQSARIGIDPIQNKKDLPKILSQFAKRVAPFEAVLEYPGPYVLDASLMIAKQSIDLWRNLLKSKSALDKNDLTQLVEPLRQKAIEVLASGLSRANDSKMLSPALAEMVDLKGRLTKTGYSQQTAIVLGEISGISGDENSLEKSRAHLVSRSSTAENWLDYGNALYKKGEFFFARLAYQKALAIQPKNSDARHNIALIVLDDSDWEDPFLINEGLDLLKGVLRSDPSHRLARQHLAELYNYFRLFFLAQSTWLELLEDAKNPAVFSGLAFSQAGLSEQNAKYFAKIDTLLKKSRALGDKEVGYSGTFLNAARLVAQKDARCRGPGEKLNDLGHTPLEIQSAKRLMEECVR